MKHWYIFDCYGTLVHSISNAWAKEFLKYVENTKERIHRLITTPTSIQEHLHSDTFAYIDKNVKWQIIQLLQEDTTILYDDAHRIIEHCIGQDIPFCGLSNLSADYKKNIEELIITPYQNYHDKLFKVFFSCDIGSKKPEKEAYDLAINFLQENGVRKEHITMIGDNRKYDFLRPRELGLDGKWIQRNSLAHDIKDSDTIYSFDDLWEK